jgi:hypothetical protein
MNVALSTSFRFRQTLARSLFSICMASSIGIVTSANYLFTTPVYAQQEASTATIVIESVADTNATRGRKLAVTYYQDEQCSRRGKSNKVFSKNYAKDLHRFNPWIVETDIRLIFQVNYIEKRRDETRACDAISSVSLKPGRSYRAIFRVVDDVVGCNIRVFDVTDIIQKPAVLATGDQQPKGDSSSEPQFLEVPVKDSYPESTCVKVGEKGYKSGTPVYSYQGR